MLLDESDIDVIPQDKPHDYEETVVRLVKGQAPKDDFRFDEAVDASGADGLAAIANTIAMFRMNFVAFWPFTIYNTQSFIFSECFLQADT